MLSKKLKFYAERNRDVARWLREIKRSYTLVNVGAELKHCNIMVMDFNVHVLCNFSGSSLWAVVYRIWKWHRERII